ncbi:MAG TPA: tRNA dihydrouridine synthase DusB, partial [Opitutaceae bacterium]|nr:tRNA dihydrouridine synthase DusB [Opitutaceae bacterium]
EVFGEDRGCRMFRKAAAWYTKRCGPVGEFRHRLVNFKTRAEFDATLAAFQAWRTQFCDARGELLPRYRPAEPPPLGTPGPDAIPVPKGPVAVW